MFNKPLKNLTIYFLIVILWAILFIPNNGSTRQLQYEEGRHALRARDILNNGEWLLPRVCGERYVKKPPLFPWLVVITSRITGELNETSLRLPGLLGLLLTAGLVFSFIRRYVSNSAAFFAIFILFTVPEVLRSAPLGETDILIMFSSFSVFYYWWLSYSEKTLKVQDWVIAGLLLSLGALLKGPVVQIFFIPAVFIYIFTAHCPKKHYVGLLICLIVSFVPLAVWALLIYKNGDIHKWITELFRLNSQRSFGNYIAEHLYYIGEVMVSYAFWPVVAGIFLKRKLLAKGLSKTPLTNLYYFIFLYLLCGSIIIFFFLNPRPRYIISIAPVLAIVAGFIYQEWGRGRKYTKYIWAGIGVIVLLRLVYLFAVIPYYSNRVSKRQDAQTISKLTKGQPIFQLSPGPCILIFYIDGDIRPIRLDNFLKREEGGFILADYDLAKKIIQNNSFNWSIAYGPFSYNDKKIVLIKAEKLK